MTLNSTDFTLLTYVSIYNSWNSSHSQKLSTLNEPKTSVEQIKLFCKNKDEPKLFAINNNLYEQVDDEFNWNENDLKKSIIN